ncbi:MAG: cobaltochelatase subunit CobT, partial [Pseudomonadota bacterium]
ATNRPSGGAAQAIFDAAEAARVESVGARAMAGVAQNLDALQDKRCREKNFERATDRQNAPMPEIIGLLVREALSGAPVPDSAKALVASWRPFIEDRASDTLAALDAACDDQAAFADLARKLIDELDFGETPDEAGSPDEDDRANDQDRPPENDDQQDGTSDQSGPEPDGFSSRDLDFSQDMSSEEGDQRIDIDAQMAAELAESDSDGEGDTPFRPSFTGEGPPDPNAYHPFTTEFDEIVQAEDLCDAEELDRLRRQLDQQLTNLQGVVGRLANRLQRRLLAQQNRTWQFDLEEGVLDTSRLARVIADPSNPLSYMMEDDIQFRDTIVTLLIDNSGSMRGRPIMVAATCADILARTLERCSVKVEILGFTTRAWKGGRTKEKWLQSGKPPRPGRLNDLRHVIYKPADMPWRRARPNMGLMLKEGLLKENVDGEALIWASQRLMTRPEQRRILMVISDGAPVDDETSSKNSINYLERHLRQVIGDLEGASPIELLAIGIGHDVTRYYSRAVTIIDAEQLGGAMTEKLAELFDDQPDPRGHRARGPSGEPPARTKQRGDGRIGPAADQYYGPGRGLGQAAVRRGRAVR